MWLPARVLSTGRGGTKFDGGGASKFSMQEKKKPVYYMICPVGILSGSSHLYVKCLGPEWRQIRWLLYSKLWTSPSLWVKNYPAAPAVLWESSGPQKTFISWAAWLSRVCCLSSEVQTIRFVFSTVAWPCFVSKSNSALNSVLSVCSGSLKKLFSSWFQWCMKHRMMNWRAAFWRCLRMWLPAHWPGKWFITCCNIKL